MSGSKPVGGSSPTPPSIPQTPQEPQKKGPAPQLSRKASETKKTSILSRSAAAKKPSRLLKSDSTDSPCVQEEETSFTTQLTSEQKKAIAQQKSLVSSFQKKVAQLKKKRNQSRQDWGQLHSLLNRFKQIAGLSRSPKQTLHDSLKLYASLKQALEELEMMQAASAVPDLHDDAIDEILNLAHEVATIAVTQLPDEIRQLASAGLASSLATDQVASWMMYYNEAYLHPELFENPESQEGFRQLCQEMAAIPMTSTNQAIYLPPPSPAEVKEGRERTEKEISKDLTEMRKNFRQQHKIVFPAQAKKDLLRTSVTLTEGGKKVYNSLPVLKSMDWLSRSGRVSPEQKGMISEVQEKGIARFLTGLEPEQQMQIISRLSQTEQLDMSDSMTKSLLATLPEWGVPSTEALNRSVSVDREGDTVTVTHSFDAALVFMDPLDGAFRTLQYNDRPPATLTRTITFRPGQKPELGPLSIDLTLPEPSGIS